MSNQEKSMTRSSKFKVPSANLQTISSYLVQIFHKYYLFFFSLFYFFVFLFFVETKILYIPIHIWLCSRMSEKKKLPVWFPETKLLFLFEHVSYNIKFFSAYFSLIKNLFIFIENTEFWIRFVAENCCQWLVWFPYIFC